MEVECSNYAEANEYSNWKRVRPERKELEGHMTQVRRQKKKRRKEVQGMKEGNEHMLILLHITYCNA